MQQKGLDILVDQLGLRGILGHSLLLLPLNLLQDCLSQPPAQGLFVSHSGNTTLVENIRVNSDRGVWCYSCPRSTYALCHVSIVMAVILKVKGSGF